METIHIPQMSWQLVEYQLPNFKNRLETWINEHGNSMDAKSAFALNYFQEALIVFAENVAKTQRKICSEVYHYKTIEKDEQYWSSIKFAILEAESPIKP